MEAAANALSLAKKPTYRGWISSDSKRGRGKVSATEEEKEREVDDQFDDSEPRN